MASISLPDFGLLGQGIGGVGSAVGDLITQSGYYKAARQYTQAGNLEGEAATIFGQNANISRASGAIEASQARRSIYKSESGTEAQAGGAGLRGGAGVGDILRSSASQGALKLALVGAQTEINVNAYKEQQVAANVAQQGYYAESDNATAQGNFAGSKSGFDMLSGVASIVGAGAAMFL